ncbi:MAG: cell wall metabolism sensor histidine kinase WalK [Defluviitaleaceae bacterium]|nr:cell wall metabolism sensor histidine kinase WalK [Defluviitaleaceae bacterium]MCL2262048.1 cell wall metabolism sensor histidine kinase WalK [Defluviitaleaceae bacterium]
MWAITSDKLPWYHSLRWRLAIIFIALSIVPLLVFNVIIMAFIQDYFLNDRISELSPRAIVMSNIVTGFTFDGLQQTAPLLVLQERVRVESAELGVRIIVIDDNARVIEDSNVAALDSLIGQTILNAEVINALSGNDSVYLQRGEENVLFITVSARDEVSGRVGAVMIVANVDDIFESLSGIRAQLYLYSLAVGLLVIVLVFVTSQRLITPLRQIVRTVQRMSAGQLNQRIPITSRDEYSILSATFNDMTEKLEQVERTREEFVSNVSHELKTPLTAIKVLSESILSQESVPEEVSREFMQDINSEVDRMVNITNDLLALVKVEQREQSLNIAPTDINALVEDILKRLSPLAEEKKVVLLYEEVRPVQIDADEIKLALAISNIVENGIKYTPRGGTVKVVVDSDHQSAFITIQDTGIGIPEDEQDKIFNRFYRVDKTRDRDTGGTGLGLAISRSTVLLHDGSIRITSKPDEGSVFVLRIPLRRS